MKKLLLLSLLSTLGITSFAAVQGTENKAEMPIVVRGSVIDKTGVNLIIEPIKNAGVNGTSMEFDFGGIVQGQTQSLEGTFAIYRANSTDVISNDLAKIEVGILNPAGTGVVADDASKAGADGKVSLQYSVSSTLNPEKNRIEGAIAVIADVADDADTKSFLDTTKKLAIIVTP